MGHRILMGVLLPKQSSGNATIYFDSHDVAGDADGVHLQDLGDKSGFKQPPAGFVSLKHFTFQDKNDPRPEIPEQSWWDNFINDIRLLFRSVLRSLSLQNDESGQSQNEPGLLDEDVDRVVMESYELKNDAPTTDQMVIRWRATNGAEIKEISYLIVGDS